MDLGLQGKRVLVTAGSEGLGFATAKAFAAEGAHVWLASRNEAKLQRAAEEIQSETGNEAVQYVVVNVAHKVEIDAMFDAVEATGGVDVLVNNAGGPKPGTFDAVDEEAWQAAFQLSLMSVVRSTQRALPHMRSQRWGRILNFTSSSMKQPLDNLILSNTFRTAVAGLSKSLASELGPDNILVNAIGPGRIATNRVASLDEATAARTGQSVAAVQRASEDAIPLLRYGQPDEFAKVVVFLGSPVNGYVTGQALLVDGGMVRAL